MDPSMSNILFNSRQFYLDNSYSGDIFAGITSATIAADGSTLFFRRSFVERVEVANLDSSGLPILDLTDGPFLGFTSFNAPASYIAAPRGPIAYDLAGNIYTAGNLGAGGERLGIYSPGGDTTAITRSNGTFTINGTTYGDHLIGDLSGDGFVGIDDLSIVLGNWNDAVAHGVFTLGDPTGDGFVGIDDLNVVLSHWNEGTPPTNGSQTHIPEPTSLWLLGAGAWACGVRTGRRKKQI